MEFFQGVRPLVVIFGEPFDGEVQLHSLLGDMCDLRVIEDIHTVIRTAVTSAVPTLLLIDVDFDKASIFYIFDKLMGDQRTFATPVIFYGSASNEVLIEYYALGAAGHIFLPSPAEVIASIIKSHLKQYEQLDLVRVIGNQLEATIVRRTKEVADAQDVTILAMASLAEARDAETGNHIRRTQHYILVLCEYLRGFRKFSQFLSDATIERIFKSAPLHDIGKVGIPDSILLKPDRLSDYEFEIMKTHTTLGKKAIENAESQLGVKLEFLTTAKEIAYTHQEKWDGTGYPQGLMGSQIPLSGRLMAIADVYDALISVRVYKGAMSHDEAVGIIKNGSGSHFDPDLVDAFLIVQDKFQDVARRFNDTTEVNGNNSSN
jgi:putative two-component system response regulator